MTSLAASILPDDIIWTDEHKWVPVTQTLSRTAGGRAIIQHGELSGARPITLTCHWITKTILDELSALRDTAGAVALLTLPDGRTFNTMFRNQDQEPIVAKPVIDRPIYEAVDLFDVTLKLMEI